MIFERFCMVTTPPASVICELASPPPENLGITFTGPTRPSIVFVAPDEPTGATKLVGAPLALGTTGAATTVAVPGVDSDAAFALALAKAETGNPPRVCAFSA